MEAEQRVAAYLYDLTDENRGVVSRLHQDSLGDNFTVVEGLRAQACFSQAACIDQLEHLTRDNEELRVVFFLNRLIPKSGAVAQ